MLDIFNYVLRRSPLLLVVLVSEAVAGPAWIGIRIVPNDWSEREVISAGYVKLEGVSIIRFSELEGIPSKVSIRDGFEFLEIGGAGVLRGIPGADETVDFVARARAQSAVLPRWILVDLPACVRLGALVEQPAVKISAKISFFSPSLRRTTLREFERESFDIQCAGDVQ